MIGAEIPEVPVTEVPDAKQQAMELAQLRETQRRAHLGIGKGRARRSSVLTARQLAEVDEYTGQRPPQPEHISVQPDVGRAVRRGWGVRFAFNMGNQPYVRTEPKRLSKKARKREESK